MWPTELADRRQIRVVLRCCLTSGLIVFGLLLTLPTQALEFRCENNGDIRFIRVDVPGEEHLCEVNVHYESTGEQKTMWYANNNSMFCSARAHELTSKYETLWGFSCLQWPDHDGVEQLSPAQRAILDQRLKRQLADKTSASREIIGVRAAASTSRDGEFGTIAVQYFFSDGTDQTELINTETERWQVFATVNDLAGYITGPDSVNTALITAVTTSGALEVATTVTRDDAREHCYGQQMLTVNSSTRVQPRSEHRVICY